MAMSVRTLSREHRSAVPRASTNRDPRMLVDAADPSSVRTCTRCGERVPFTVELRGSWAECSACGHLA